MIFHPQRERASFCCEEGGDGGMSVRQYYKAKIIAGFCANPAIFAQNANCGWSLVNCKDSELTGYAGKLADEMLSEDASFAEKQKPGGREWANSKP